MSVASPAFDATDARSTVEAGFLDDVTLRRPSGDTDGDGNPLADSDAPIVATTRGTLTVGRSVGRPSGDRPSDTTAATCSLSLATDVAVGDLVDVRGRTWRVGALEQLRSRQRVRLELP